MSPIGRSPPVRQRSLLLALYCLALWAIPVRGQGPGGEIRQNALRVFLDCRTFPCSSTYLRTEVAFVNWVRDRTLADVHLIITSSQTGGGGRHYVFDFIGFRDLAGQDDRLTLTSLGTDTQDEILSGLSRVIAAGFARYATLIGQVGGFEISAVEEAEPGAARLVAADQVQDPWSFWVFEISSSIYFEGEETERRRRYRGSIEARRTTETWKSEFEWFGNSSRDERELEDGSVIMDDRTNWSANILLAYALADHWSIGTISGAGASTRRNEEFGSNASGALEYSFFPYEDAPRQSLTLRYEVGLRYFDWREETIFGRTEELRPLHELRLQLFQRQPWGESRASIDGRQYLHDSSKWSIGLSGDVEFRIVRGLELEIEADLEFIEDQLFLARAGLTDEEILLGRFDRPTDTMYEVSVGFSFEFGSIYNNVVNNRF